MPAPPSALEIARALLRFPSVTPVDAGALPYLRDLLGKAGFAADLVTFEAGERPRSSTSMRGSETRGPISPSPATPTSCRRATRRAGGSTVSAEIADGVLAYVTEPSRSA